MRPATEASRERPSVELRRSCYNQRLERTELRLILEKHASLAPAEYELSLATSGFPVRACVADDPDCGAHTVWLATYEA